MTEVIPAILVDDFIELKEKLSQVVGLAKTVQIDICDGKFVKSTSWPIGSKNIDSVESILNEEDGLPFWDSVDFEFDLMVRNAHTQFDFFIKLGAKRIIFHLEAEGDLDRFNEFLEAIDMYTRENVDIGVAINTNTDINNLKNIIQNIDFVQCMGIEKIGYQGEPFDVRVLNQIKTLREIYPELIISVDGSVNETTAPKLVEAGANRLVVGSAFMNSYDVRATIKELENL